jgi:SpoVK/Ycf46/Vps4 family AAA+-type ATPase
VFTSNFPERFDRALIRPGRIDMIIHFKKCSRTVLREMVEGFYDITDVDHELWSHPELDEKWSPAEVNQILFRNFENPKQAMDELLTLDSSNPLLKKEEDSTPI